MGMKRFTSVLVGLALLCGCTNQGDTEGPEPVGTAGEAGYAPIPPGYDWPADPATLERAVRDRDLAAVRQHGWKLWAGINQPISDSDQLPVWWTWSTTTQLFETDQVGARILAARRKPQPAQAAASAQPCTPDICLPSPKYPVPPETITRFKLTDGQIRDGRHFQNNGDIMVATESYSLQAAAAIERLAYNQAATYNGLLAKGLTMLPDLPPEHVVTKHMYWPVKAGTLTPLPLYDGVPEARWHVYNGYETWERFVAVDPGGGNEGETVELQFLFGVQRADGSPLPTRTVKATTVSMERFYHQKVDQSLWDQLNNDDRAMLDAASRWTSGKPFEIDDYVVAVAMHINTKELPSWALQSVWWHDQPDVGPHATDRPSLPDAKGPWRHYLLTTAYAIPTDKGDLPMSFNPYIELAASHPVPTNCRNCHLRAAWPKARAWYLQDGGPGPLADILPNDPVFAGALLLDFQWVFSDRVQEP